VRGGDDEMDIEGKDDEEGGKTMRREVRMQVTVTWESLNTRQTQDMNLDTR